MIIAITCVRNEADILEFTFRHLFKQGIHRILAIDHGSTDGTGDRLRRLARALPIEIVHYDAPCFEQAEWMNALAGNARLLGANWILPFDADEWWIPKRHATIAEALASILEKPAVIRAQVFQHVTMAIRFREPHHLPKVAITGSPMGAKLGVGSHTVNDLCGRVVDDLLEVRELQFRGADHYVRKMRDRLSMLRPHSPANENRHYKRVAGFTEDQLRAEYRRYCDQPIEVDMIPSEEWPPQSWEVPQ